MSQLHPLAQRLLITKGLGFILGMIVFFSTADLLMMVRLGLLLYITLLGGVIGLMGFLTHHPVWKGWRIHWWMRGGIIGAFFALVLTLLIEPTLVQLMQSYGLGTMSPYWSLLEWTLWGILLDGLATKYAGEGKMLSQTL